MKKPATEGSTARQLTNEEARAEIESGRKSVDAVRADNGLPAIPSAPQVEPQSRTVAAGLEYLATLEADNAALKRICARHEVDAKLDKLEIEDLRSRLATADSRVAELQIRSDQSVADFAQTAAMIASIEAILKAAKPIPDANDPDRLTMRREPGVTVGH